MNDSEEVVTPDSDTCQKIIDMFAEITGADEACAQYFLQNQSWELERSVSAYFEAARNCKFLILHGEDIPPLIVTHVKDRMMGKLRQQMYVSPPRLSVVSWNLNGLHESNLKQRTKAVCKILNQENADIIFLQELIPQTFRYISEKLPDYMCIGGDTKDHFSAVLLKRVKIFYDSHIIIPYSGTNMGRNLINVEVHVGEMKFHLFNTHLENGVENKSERKSQLQKIFECINKVPEGQNVIFGGDLNISDEELDAVNIPTDVDDTWKLCGAQEENKYTWDTLHNTNKSYTGKYKPQMRFDRLYVRYSHPRSVVAKHFGLLGKQKIACTQSYPSDHWGIRVLFGGEQLENE